MQVLIKRIQKRGARSFVWRCGTGSFGGVNLIPPPPCPAALQPCFHVLPLSHQAALVYLNIRRSHRVKARKRIEWHSAHFFLFHLPSLHPCHPKPSRLSLTGEVINFIYTLIRPSRRKPLIVNSGGKGFMGILTAATVKILVFDCHSIGE